jgi:hypothetical protein
MRRNNIQFIQSREMEIGWEYQKPEGNPNDQENLKPFVSFPHSKSISVRLSILTRILVIFFEFVNSLYEAIWGF